MITLVRRTNRATLALGATDSIPGSACLPAAAAGREASAVVEQAARLAAQVGLLTVFDELFCVRVLHIHTRKKLRTTQIE